MSGLDPLAAALAAKAAAGAQAAIEEAILSLGGDVAILQSQISVGDVVAATVLPPQGGTDLLSFLGQTVPAQIPPGVNPGESLLLQVTAFTNNAVIVRNLGTVDPANPVPTVDVQLPPAAPDAPLSAVLTTIVPQSSPAPPPPVTAQTPLPPPAATTNVAPPRAVFVAAAVRATPPTAPPASPRADVPVRASVVLPAAVDTSDVEARIALTRATIPPPPPPATNTPAANAPASNANDATVPARAVVPQPASSASPPPSDPRIPGRLPVAPPIVLYASPRTPAAGSAPPIQASSVKGTPETPETPQTPEAALLTRLNVPITPATLAAARLIESATTSMTQAYERLETLLGRLSPQQIPVALRSVLGFVSRMDMRNSAALPEQIAAFVSDVVDGPEAKIAQAVQAWLELSPEPVQTPAPLPGAPTPAAVTTATAQAAERAVALEFDAKAAIMTMIAEQTSTPSSAVLAGALRDALAATTAVQLGALSAQTNNPGTITLAIPAYFHEGGSPVQLQISRDAPESKNKMDGDNFHIAFVLDTASLGTVAINVQTVGRAVSVDVKTQGSGAADRFRNTLGDLRGRLERLRYRVSSIGADVAPVLGAQPAAKQAAPEPPPVRRRLWDTQA